MFASVRSKLALSTGLSLLLLLLVFHIGSRLIFVRAFEQAERELLQAMPDVKRMLLQEIDRLRAATDARASDPATVEFLKAGPDGRHASIFPPELMRVMDVRLFALLDARGELIDGGSIDSSATGLRPLSASFRRNLGFGSPLVTFQPGPPKHHGGMLRADEGGLIVSASAVHDPLDHRILGVLVLGRAADEPETAARIAATIPGLQPGKRRVVLDTSRNGSALAPLSPEMLKDSVELGGLLFWRTPFGMLEARMPVYDIYGYPAFFLVFSLPRSMAGLAEGTLAWLTLMVACTGMLFVIPLFLIQGHTVLNPLSRLAREIQTFSDGGPAGRRLNWRRQDEFGQVALSVDRMLDGMERGQAQVAEGELRYRAFLDVIPDTLYAVDRHGTILDAKAKPGSRLENRAGRLSGRPLADAGLPTETCRRLLDGLLDVLASGDLQTLEFSMVQPDGSPFWGELRIARMEDDRGLVIERNITDRRQSEEERRQLGERMSQMRKMESLGMLAGGIAHDFNNILTAIVGHAELIGQALPPDSPVRNSAASIQRAAMRAAGLTRQMLAYAGKGEFALQVLDLNHLLEDLVPLLQTSLSKKATLEIRFAPDLPSVQGDATQLWQVAMNLLINASDALSDTTGRITLATRRMEARETDLAGALSDGPLAAGTYAVLEVEDTGKGMDAAVCARIFDPFFSTKASGRGLGLSAVLGIVRAHGGGIEVKSSPGSGTTFRIFLPASTQPVEPVTRPAIPTPPPPRPDRLSRPTVLLAEDEPDIRCAIAQTLTSAGFDVLAVPDGRQAVTAVRERRKDIAFILLDVEMPEMNGEEAMRAIRTISGDIKVFVMSGYGTTILKERFKSLAVAGFIAKPFTRDQLLDMLSAVGVVVSEPA
jgi:signal transduction histidine kinase/CheY-like chemotaxis protein